MVMLIRQSGGIVHHVAYLLNQVIFQLTHPLNGFIAMGLQQIQMWSQKGFRPFNPRGLISTANLTVIAVNDAPQLTGEKASLIDGYKNWNYAIQEIDLLKGYTDIDSDTLAVKNLKSSKGAFKDLGNGLWHLSAPSNEGDILLTYLVEDANGAVVSANQSFTVRQAVLEGTNQTESITGNGRDEWVYAYNGFDTIRAAGVMTVPMAGMAMTQSTVALAMTSSMASKTTISSGAVLVMMSFLGVTAMTTSEVVVVMIA